MSRPPWRIVFFGTPLFAIPSLEELVRGEDVVAAVVTQPDRAKGRGQKIVPSPVKELALRQGIIPLQPEGVKGEAFLGAIKDVSPDLLVVVAFGRMLPAALLGIPRFGTVNVHGSLLPKYRGAAPIPWAILRGETVTGVTTMLVDEGMDTGDILMQAEILIEEEDTGGTLQKKLALSGAKLLGATIEKMKAGEISSRPQDHSQATYASPIQREDGRIDWNRGAEEIARQIRAFNPRPGAFTVWEQQVLKIYQGKVRKRIPQARPGAVVWTGLDFIEIETGKDCLLVEEVQLEGKKKMHVRDFLSGHRITDGTVFHSLSS